MISDAVTVIVGCIKCAEPQHITVGQADLDAWQSGTLIQDAMPYLSADERELLISQTCGDCWEKMFGDCEE